MQIQKPFSVFCPTGIRFGEGISAGLSGHMPAGTKKIAFVRGGQGPELVDDLRAKGLTVHEVRCRKEPEVDDINALAAQLKAADIQAVVSCGGGAVIDTGKALAFCLSSGVMLTDDFSGIDPEHLDRPSEIFSVAVPTTAGTGSEVTMNAVLGIPSRGAKVSLRGRALVPDLALVDPLLMIQAPRHVVLNSGLDAVVQTIEAYTSNAATVFTDALVRPNIGRGLTALKQVVETDDRDAWGTLAWVSLSSGLALANGGLGAAHGLASVIGGRAAAPHGALCGLFLAPVIRQNLLNAGDPSDVSARLKYCVDVIAGTFPPRPGRDALSGLEDWSHENGLPRLSAYGVRPADINDIAEQSATASSSRKNAVALRREDFAHILESVL